MNIYEELNLHEDLIDKNGEFYLHIKYVRPNCILQKDGITFNLNTIEVELFKNCVYEYCYIVKVKNSFISKILYCTTTKESFI